MDLTRVDTGKLRAAATKAESKLDEALGALEHFLVLLTEHERATTPRVRDGFPDAARALARALKGHEKLAEIAGYDADAVIEDLDNVEALRPLAEKADALARRLQDSRLAWLAEAYIPTLAVYAHARVAGKTNAEIAHAVEPLQSIFATRRQAKRAPAAGASGAGG